ncbi:MAG: hypothetical protein JRJ20_03625 [Deltaproteobacteria bacterium]|nr:hypothetical protein [Deltaproteobacteria bacterium]MBW1900707.1 hypothetical protein [Deltaproteobacteria bacterium]MBW2143380.1 hypothetical protein [Deltaproteobacteria bacterium]
MAEKIIPERIVSIAKKINVYTEDLSTDDLLNAALDKIEELVTQSGWRYRKENQEFIRFYKDCMEEIEQLREYQDTFI